MSACEEWLDENTGMPQFTCASEVVIARDDEWAFKIVFKQNRQFPKELWKIDRSYNIEELDELLAQKDHVIIELGANY